MVSESVFVMLLLKVCVIVTGKRVAAVSNHSQWARETIELLTEGGADIIIPWQAANSIGQWKEEKDALSKWKSWTREATKQSRRS